MGVKNIREKLEENLMFFFLLISSIFFEKRITVRSEKTL